MNVLILAPHTDDGEFGCGGTIAKHVDNGDEVFYVAFSKCEQSVPEGLPRDILVKELYNATSILGIKKANVVVLDFPVRRFSEHRQEILEKMIEIRKQYNPQIVYSPSVHDTHQDHNVIAEESRRAFKYFCLYAYEAPWNNFTFNNQRFSVLTENLMEKKMKAIACYASQYGRDYSNREFIYGQAKYHGVQIGQELAEVFEVVRQIDY